MDQTQLQVGGRHTAGGATSHWQGTTRVLSPSGKALHFTELSSPTSKQQKDSVLTPDDTDVFLRNTLDLTKLTALLQITPNAVHDQKLLSNLMARCVLDKEVVPFSSVSERHLRLLGLETTYYPMELHPDLEEKAKQQDSLSNNTLHAATLKKMHEHFNVSKVSGCRCIIDQYLLVAVACAQDIIDNDIALADSLSKKYKILKPHIGVFTEHPVPHTTITCDNVSYTFHGVLDYAIGVIEKRDMKSLAKGSMFMSRFQILYGILETKSLAEMENAVPQIIAEVVTILVLTGKLSFTCALTNGALWRFFTAYNKDSHLKVYVSAEFDSKDDAGVIIELLKDMILYPISPLVATDFEKDVVYGTLP